MILRRFTGALALILSSHVAAINCPDPDNLVGNCGFDVGIAGYAPQDGDAILHEPVLGSTADGAMRVSDTPADGNTDAEAELCVNVLADTPYRIGADFLAETATQCVVGWDEFVQPGCVQTNGIYKAAAPLPVTDIDFTTFQTVQQTSAGVQSVELVIVCDAGGTLPTQFLVDDVFVVTRSLFANGFEGQP